MGMDRKSCPRVPEGDTMTSGKHVFESAPYTHAHTHPTPLVTLVSLSPSFHPLTFPLSTPSPAPSLLQEGITKIVEATEWKLKRALDKESSLSPVLHSQLCLQLAMGHEASLCPSLGLSFPQCLLLRLGLWPGTLDSQDEEASAGLTAHLDPSVLGILGEAEDVPTHPLSTFPGPVDVIGRLKETAIDQMPLPHRPIPASSRSGPSGDMGLPSTAKSRQFIRWMNRILKMEHPGRGDSMAGHKEPRTSGE